MGKGVFIWRHTNIHKGNPKLIADSLVSADVSQVAIKIHNGYAVWNGLEGVIGEIRSRGIEVIGWGYIYLNNQITEANAAVKACRQYGIEKYLIDAESHAKKRSAKAFADILKRDLSGVEKGLCTFWKPTYHPELHWSEFRSICSFDAPQVYWRGQNPVGKLNISKYEYSKMTPKLPFRYAGGDMYKEYGIKPTPEQVTQFLQACKDDPEIEGVLMWSMDQMAIVPELWNAFASFDWAGNPITGKLSSFLEEAKKDARQRQEYYGNIYEEHRANGTQPELAGREPIEAAVLAGVRNLLK